MRAGLVAGRWPWSREGKVQWDKGARGGAAKFTAWRAKQMEKAKRLPGLDQLWRKKEDESE